MKLKKYQYYYCNSCHKMYVFDDDWSENFARLGKPAKVISLTCSHCRYLQSQSSVNTINHEIHTMFEAYRILKMNEENQQKVNQK